MKEKYMFKCILMQIQTDKASPRTCVQRQSHGVLRSTNKQSDVTEQLGKHCTNGIPRREGGREGGRQGGREKKKRRAARKQAQRG